MAKLLEGRSVAEKIREEIKIQVQGLKNPPFLASILVGDDPGAATYAQSQAKIAEKLGIVYKLFKLKQDITEEALIDFIFKLNADKTVNGIIVQMPVSQHIDYKKIVEFISPLKDVEGMHPANMGKVLFGRSRIVACTANSVMELLNSTGLDLYGKETVIVGHSEIVGKPLMLLLLEKFATVTVCHIGTSKVGKLEGHVRRAEILIVAVGQAGLIKGDWIKEGSIVIDVGINRINDKIVGDVEFEEAQKRAAYITPVPGGVGPLTVTVLMRNLVEAAKLQQ
ncbi:MAG: bifunctional 5,10-methylenetetrahydrofolate dehydrogenase/5,10-methenyltetrahydrofolate cyclohydrolase [Candidatus Omnitrophica bacterium]|nr:bifunctional 5,10-methylenetetrahydrofolate dehydrogenase/5,10-methenyltetrahydrofolate cyclohydrolase [Candidatus Omnitrophota bacterium]MDD5690173.1 bifunctional 5,10-methylenetetrahydrofolate dehydrogenase/5,10-methenyltetrahydrofolate cyclohydrolase [Candidatus Omnitrophota bacterium]